MLTLMWVFLGAEEDDDWGTQTVPVRKETNVIVDRIESVAERRRRERKEAKATKANEREAEKEVEQYNRERALGVAGQVTATRAVVVEEGKRSNGDINCRNVTISVGSGGQVHLIFSYI